MESPDEISKCSKYLEIGRNVQQSLNRLLQMDASLDSFKAHKVKQLASRYSKDVEHSDVAKKLMDRIQKMEDDSKKFRKPYNVRNPGSRYRKRSFSSSNSELSFTLPDITTPLNPSLSTRLSSSVQKEPEIIEVSKLQNLEESDYDRVRPTLITLSAKQLKSFMDRNPRIEKVADGLFRRHCQRDCPEEVPKKVKMETWRTVHDVYINWKLYEEAKLWEKDLK